MLGCPPVSSPSYRLCGDTLKFQALGVKNTDDVEK